MPTKGESATQTRVYVTPEVNDLIDLAHLRTMTHCGYKISKTDFISEVVRVGLENETALYEAFETVDKVS